MCLHANIRKQYLEPNSSRNLRFRFNNMSVHAEYFWPIEEVEEGNMADYTIGLPRL